ncbi:MAG: DUF2164 domain-containing protein [Gemmatimonadaceae bacterium]|nr:DUF2164 domain-containing protein [Gemmatimonadaceae bacterium]
MHKPSTLSLDQDVRKQAIVSIRGFVTSELELDLSDLQATLLLDHLLADIGPAIYNQAAADARRFVEDRAADLEAALQKAEFPVSGRRRR